MSVYRHKQFLNEMQALFLKKDRLRGLCLVIHKYLSQHETQLNYLKSLQKTLCDSWLRKTRQFTF